MGKRQLQEPGDLLGARQQDLSETEKLSGHGSSTAMRAVSLVRKRGCLRQYADSATEAVGNCSGRRPSTSLRLAESVLRG
jgi:hypothetical protein